MDLDGDRLSPAETTIAQNKPDNTWDNVGSAAHALLIRHTMCPNCETTPLSMFQCLHVFDQEVEKLYMDLRTDMGKSKNFRLNL